MNSSSHGRSSHVPDFASLCPLHALRARRPQWGRALESLRALLDDPDHTEHAMQVAYALDPDEGPIQLRRVLATSLGRALYRDRPSLEAAVCDRDRLRALPDESYGRAYLAHLERNGLRAEKILQLRRDTDPVYPRADEGLRWWLDRSALLHDLWHVLTGLGADGAGEAMLLPFTWAQRGGRSNGLLTIGAALRISASDRVGWARALWGSWQRGRRAVLLDALPYETLLEQPLSLVRRAAAIGPPVPFPVPSAAAAAH